MKILKIFCTPTYITFYQNHEKLRQFRAGNDLGKTRRELITSISWYGLMLTFLCGHLTQFKGCQVTCCSLPVAFMQWLNLSDPMEAWLSTHIPVNESPAQPSFME